MDIYNFLLRKNNYETEDYAFLLFYHPDKVNKDGNIIFNTDLIKMNISIKNAENIFKKAITVLKGKIPKESEECGYCRWNQELTLKSQ